MFVYIYTYCVYIYLYIWHWDKQMDLFFFPFKIFWPYHSAHGILGPNQGLNPCPLHWVL